MRIAICGKMGRGKTTCANYLCRKYRFKKLSFAAKLKNIVQDLRPDMFENNKKPRGELIIIGAVLKEILGQNIWVDYVLREIDKMPESQNIVIDDLRFVHEEMALKKVDFIIIKLTGKNHNEKKESRYDNDKSETDNELIEEDFTIENYDLNNTFKMLDKIMKVFNT